MSRSWAAAALGEDRAIAVFKIAQAGLRRAKAAAERRDRMNTRPADRAPHTVKVGRPDQRHKGDTDAINANNINILVDDRDDRMIA
jgi:hypothetical protein